MASAGTAEYRSAMTIDAVFFRRKQYFQNGYRPFAVWSPGAVDHNGEPINNAGKRAKGADWRARALEDVPYAVRMRPDSTALNTGFLTDLLPTIDVDVRQQDIVDRIVAMIERTAGVTPLVRQGEAPKLALFYRSAEPFQRVATPKLQFGPGEKPTMVEIMGEGQSIMADGIHPGTGRPYRWLDQHPLDLGCDGLPELSLAIAKQIIESAEKILRAAGAEDWVNPNETREDEPPPRAARKEARGGEGDGFFRRVNELALQHAEDWVRVLWPQLRGPAPNGAWRILAPWRGLPASKQDLSIDPQHGIRDFHLDKPLSAVDLVLEYGGLHKEPLEAALWLCERIGQDPHRLGYRSPGKPGGPRQPPPGGEEPPPPETPPPGSIPERVIWIYGGLRHVAAREGIVAMREHRVPFYRRDWLMMRVCPRPVRRATGELVEIEDMITVAEPILGAELAQSARWQKVNSRGAVVRIDPDPVVPLVAQMHTHWHFPPLHGVVRTPALRPDGTILKTPGYDAKTGFWLALDKDLDMPLIPEHPHRRQAEEALALLRDLLSGFPFVDEASRSVALSLLITPVARIAMPVVPLHLVTAPTPGTGKSYLVDVAAMIALGEPAAVIAMPPREEELEKRLIGAALNGSPIICLDNVRRMVENDFLCQLAERKVLELRPLGTSQKINVPNMFTTVINGNNLSIADDLVRRGLRCALDANRPDPEQREFSFDPLDRVRRDRGRYIAACLTIVSAYLAAGSPDKCKAYGSFENWSDRVRSALVWLGCEDPAATIQELRDDDPERQAISLVFLAWGGINELQLDPYGWMTAELIDAAERYPTLHEALNTVAPGRGAETGKIDRTRLGNWLRRRSGRIAEGFKLVANRSDKNRPRWRLVEVTAEAEVPTEERGFGVADDDDEG